MLAQDTFAVAAHDPSTPHNYIGVTATNPQGGLDATFTLDMLNGSITNIEGQIAALQAQLTDYQNMQAKVDATLVAAGA